MARETNPQDRMAGALFYVFLALLAWLVYEVFRPFLEPLGWAAVLVVVFYPLHERLERRWGRVGAAAASTGLVTLILIVPALWLVAEFVQQGVVAARGLQQNLGAGQFDFLNRFWTWLSLHIPGVRPEDLAATGRQWAEGLVRSLAERAGTVARNVAAFLFDLFVMLFALFFFFRDGEGIMNGLRRLLPFDEEHREHVISTSRDLIFASVTASLIVAAIHGLLGGIAFALVGIGSPVFWGVVMAFLSLLPIVGAWIVWLPAAVWLWAHGRAGAAILLVAFCAGMILLIENFLRPLLLSGRAQLSGLVIFVSVLGGIGVFGMLGVVLGPIVVATAAGMLDIYGRPKKEVPRSRGPIAVG